MSYSERRLQLEWQLAFAKCEPNKLKRLQKTTEAVEQLSQLIVDEALKQNYLKGNKL